MPASKSPLVVRVELGPRSYEVRISQGDPAGLGAFARQSLEACWSGRGTRNALLVTDANVVPLIGEWRRALESVGIDTNVAEVVPGEASKSFVQAAALIDQLIEMRADRHTLVVAIGGGVVGDLAGFVAATFARGLPLLMIPTTLLAQVDSAVGGKVGVNRPAAKNIVGAFHQPIGVWIDTPSLATLPDRELRCGLAEVIKYGMILDADFFDEVDRSMGLLLGKDPGTLAATVARSCVLKAEIVTRDEREETGLRAVLNFGHTIGHAIESVAGYGGDFLHGEAVAVGMVAESRLAERLGWIDASLTDRLIQVIQRAGLPTLAPGLNADDLLAAMRLDKKNSAGKIRFVLPQRIGQVELTDAPSLDDVAAVLQTI